MAITHLLADQIISAAHHQQAPKNHSSGTSGLMSEWGKIEIEKDS